MTDAAGAPDGSAPEASAPDAAQQSGLTDLEQRILEFERQWWRYAGAKEQAIRDQFGLSATRYYQTLNALIDTRTALEFDPLLVKRLRRLRDQRQRARTARRLGLQR
jgi:hypothetical protein